MAVSGPGFEGLDTAARAMARAAAADQQPEPEPAKPADDGSDEESPDP